MEFQTNQIDNEKIKTCRDFNKIENNKNLINTRLESIDSTRKGKASRFNNFFQENKLNLFKTWEGIRKISALQLKGAKKLNAPKLARKL